jgi:hypothetical protein
MENRQNTLAPITGDGLPSGRFMLHSGYARVSNFSDRQGRIIYITSDEAILAFNALYFPGINPADVYSVEIDKEKIFLNADSWDRKKIRIYDADFNYEPVDKAAFVGRMMNIAGMFPELFPEKSLCFLLMEDREKYFTGGFDRSFMMNAKMADRLILSGETERGIQMLRGTGYGLTPSGDDFNAGFILGLHFNEIFSGKDLTGLREKLYKLSIGNNLLTNSFMYNSKCRKYFKPMKNVLLLLCNEETPGLREALALLFSTGATSGADLLTGYIYSIKHRTGI